jgi:hypothetical protein
MAENPHDADAQGQHEELPADLQAIDERLATDAFLWQTRLPRTGRLDAHARMLPNRMAAVAPPSSERASPADGHPFWLFRRDDSTGPTHSTSRLPSLTRRPTAFDILAAFVVLALVGGLVLRAAGAWSPLGAHHQVAGEPTLTPAGTASSAPAATPSPTPTPTATPTPNSVPTLHGQLLSVSFPSVSPGTTSSLLEAICPAGSLMAGAGIAVDKKLPYTMVKDDPISTTTWQGEIYNAGATAITGHLSFVCLRFSGLVGQVISVDFGSINPHTGSATLDAVCPSGYRVAGGGFEGAGSTMMVVKDDPINTNRWQGEIYNSGSSPISATMRVACLEVSGLTSHVLTTTLSTSPGAANSDQLQCPSGYLVGGGGIGSDSSTIGFDTRPVDPAIWDGSIWSTSSSPVTAQMQADCLTVI